MEGSLSNGERQRLAALAAATANGLLVMFVLAVALPLLPPKLADPFWLLAFTGAFCSNGFLALLAVLLLHLAVALEPGSRRYQARRLLVRRCSRLVMVGFLLLLPLQGLAAWRGMEAAQSLSYRAGRVQQARLAQFRQAVERSSSIAELQNQLAAIQAPPLSPADQRLSLPALKADLLTQIKTQESSLLRQAGPRVPVEVLLRDSLRVVLLAPLLALAFSVSARRSSRTEVPA
ncbi:MAG: hypothetical protein ACO3B3_05740 [Cyanobium sp.]